MPRSSHAARSARGAVVTAALATVLIASACTTSDQGAPSSSATAADVTTGLAATTSGSSAAAPSTTAGGSSDTVLPTTSESLSSRSPRPTPKNPKPSGTGAVGAFSQSDSSWFAAMCSGLADKPRDKFSALTGDLQARRTAAAKLLTDQADRLETAVATLKEQKAPSVTGGAKLADAVIKSFAASAEVARTDAQKVADAGSDDELQGAFDSTLDAMNEANAPLQAFDEMMGAPAMVAQLAKVPSCAPLVG